jgi:hypothetical protein
MKTTPGFSPPIAFQKYYYKYISAKTLVTEKAPHLAAGPFLWGLHSVADNISLFLSKRFCFDEKIFMIE